MKIKRLKHCKLSQMKFFYWDEPSDDSIYRGSNTPSFFMETSNFYSDDRLRESTVINNEFYGEGYNVLCAEYDTPPPKTTKQYYERIASTVTKQFLHRQEAENFAEDWVLRR